MSAALPTSAPDGVKAVVIGASAGAVEVLLRLLPALPPAYPLPVLLVVHLPPDRDSSLATLLNARCAVPVKEAEDKELIAPGTVYVAPPGYHLLVESDLVLSLSKDEMVHYSRPSIDVLFESAADAYGNEVVGIILTGANSDGAHGLAAIHEAGGLAVVQEPASADSDAMPRAALDACPAAWVMTPEDMATALKQRFSLQLK